MKIIKGLIIFIFVLGLVVGCSTNRGSLREKSQRYTEDVYETNTNALIESVSIGEIFE